MFSMPSYDIANTIQLQDGLCNINVNNWIELLIFMNFCDHLFPCKRVNCWPRWGELSHLFFSTSDECMTILTTSALESIYLLPHADHLQSVSRENASPKICNPQQSNAMRRTRSDWAVAGWVRVCAAAFSCKTDFREALIRKKENEI